MPACRKILIIASLEEKCEIGHVASHVAIIMLHQAHQGAAMLSLENAKAVFLKLK